MGFSVSVEGRATNFLRGSRISSEIRQLEDGVNPYYEDDDFYFEEDYNEDENMYESSLYTYGNDKYKGNNMYQSSGQVNDDDDYIDYASYEKNMYEAMTAYRNNKYGEANEDAEEEEG